MAHLSFLYFIMMNLFSQVKNLHNNHIVPLSTQTETADLYLRNLIKLPRYYPKGR